MEDQEPTLTPQILARYSIEFFKTALAADNRLENKNQYGLIASFPVMYLIGHSIELCLKSFLLEKGVSRKKLERKYGHNLTKIYNKATALGFIELLSGIEKKHLEMLNDIYQSKILNYPETGGYAIPLFSALEEINEKLIKAICPALGVRYDSIYAKG